MTLMIADKAILITGANRGIGQALVEEALNRGAKRVYAGTRRPITHPDGRVVPLILDVTPEHRHPLGIAAERADVGAYPLQRQDLIA